MSLSSLELASGILLGRDDGPPLDGPVHASGSARAAFDAVLRDLLQEQPCLITFSGGRDSSAVLAVAMHVARVEGLPEPIPVTLRFPDAPASVEHEWQQHVISHLGCREWERREIHDELDLVGPVAGRLMEALGTLYPYNVHLLEPLMREARGGTLVTGLGGDQNFVPAGRALDVLARRSRPVPKDVVRIPLAFAPRSVRRAWLRRQDPMQFPWLRPEANAGLARAYLEDLARRPARWDRRLRDLWRLRFMRETMRNLARVADQAGSRIAHPFGAPTFVDALAREAGAVGYGNRSQAMRTLFGDVLPSDLTGRPTKATFNEALWNRHTVAYVEALDVPAVAASLERLGIVDLVEPERLVSHWRGAKPMPNSFPLLQECWRLTHLTDGGRA
jgi:asparagine synthase (glutamine-hydrolysing)